MKNPIRIRMRWRDRGVPMIARPRRKDLELTKARERLDRARERLHAVRNGDPAVIAADSREFQDAERAYRATDFFWNDGGPRCAQLRSRDAGSPRSREEEEEPEQEQGETGDEADDEHFASYRKADHNFHDDGKSIHVFRRTVRRHATTDDRQADHERRIAVLNKQNAKFWGVQ